MNATPQGDGLAILIVDDETLIAMLLEDVLLDLGCTVVGPAATVA
jgi:CheY-like chemotaxis protein